MQFETDGQDEIRLKLPEIVPRLLSDVAHRQVGTHVNIPAKYYDRCRHQAPDLLCDHINHWHNLTPAVRMVRELDGDVRAILSDRYKRIDNVDVLAVMLPALREVPNIEIVSCEVTPTKMYLKIVDPTVRGEPVVGDVCEAGCIISNSEIGLGSMSIEPFMRRLVCLNGMKIGDKRFRRTHVGGQVAIEEGRIAHMLSEETMQAGDHAMMLQARDVLKASINQVFFNETINKCRVAAGEVIEGDVPGAIEVLEDKYTLAKQEASDVLRHLIETGDLSRWGIANAVTMTANDVEDYDRATELEAIGGKIVEMRQSEWCEISMVAA